MLVLIYVTFLPKEKNKDDTASFSFFLLKWKEKGLIQGDRDLGGGALYDRRKRKSMVGVSLG